jgi:cellobiose PTS system EIIC component
VIVPWTTPIGLSGFLATGNSWQGAVMQIFNLFVVMAIWWPFLKILDKQYYEREKGDSSSSQAAQKAAVRD